DEVVSKVIQNPPFEICKVNQVLDLKMDIGEREAISLAVEQNIRTIVINDQRGFRKASQQGLEPMTSIRLLVLVKQAGIINSAKKVLETMRASGENITDKEWLDTLQETGELPDHSPSPLEDMQPTTSDAPLPSPSSPSNQYEDQKEKTKTEECL
ncbi:MAG: hypothetical protein HQK60_18445, partial [Deltaproteobacteria bacterium]|nr:hypothetical protein [Deltaproteobacteria bacterium]